MVVGQSETWSGSGSGSGGRVGSRGSAYVNDTAQRPDGVRAEDGIGTTASILHNSASDHDDVLGRVGQLLNHQMHHLPQAGIFVLEKLRDTEEQGRCLRSRELLTRVEEKSDFGQ